MMGWKGFASILWFSHCLAAAFAVTRQFTGSGYLEYNIVAMAEEKTINTEIYTLIVEFRTVQPSGLLFHARSSGGMYADYITLEVVGGRLRYAMRYGNIQGKDDKHEMYLGKNLDDGKPHAVKVNLEGGTTIVLDDGSKTERVERIINTYFKRLEIDTAIYIGGAPDFSALLSVKSNANFMGCLTNVEFDPSNQNNKQVIKFLEKGVAKTYPSDMDKECTTETFDPFTFNGSDSSLVCGVSGLSGTTELQGSFMFRSYEKAGTLLKQINGDYSFEISYTTLRIQLLVSIETQGQPKSEEIAAIDYTQKELITMNSGNWHHVKFTISTTTIWLEVGSKTATRAPLALPSDFFVNNVEAGGFTGCMRDLKLNSVDCKKNQVSTKNVELDVCNIIDFCVFSPCLHEGKCDQTGKSFSCECSATGYIKPVCQLTDHLPSCEHIKRKYEDLPDSYYPLDFDGPGPLKPSSVFCNFTAKPATTRIVSRETGIKLTPGRAISQRITYEHGLEAAKALARHSERCVQHIEFGCKKVKLLGDGKRSLGHWVSADGVYQDYWGGAPAGVRACACYKTRSCLDGKKCNCDAGRDVWSSDEGYLNSTTLLPVEEVVFEGVVSPGEANFTVGNLYCSGNISNTASFVNEDGNIKLPTWTPPSDGVITLKFRTPYPKGTLLYNGEGSKEYFHLRIVNETTVGLIYNIGNGARNIELSLVNKQVNDHSYHTVMIYRNMLQFGLQLDDLEGKHQNPLFEERDLNLEGKLVVGGHPYDPTKGFVGCIRGLVINGEVQDLRMMANHSDYVKSGCGAACEENACRQGGKCLDNYNVYFCDCSKTPFDGYFCQLVSPQVSVSPNDVTVLEDQGTSISCNATGVPKPKITWAFEGGDVPSGASVSITEEGSVLQLQNATKGMEGVYRCTATNKANSAVSTVTVHVLEKPTAEVSPNPHPTLMKDDKLKLTCKVSESTSEIKWKKDNGPVISKALITNDDKMSTLVIENVDTDDSGNYSCEAHNKAGSASSTVEIRVRASTEGKIFEWYYTVVPLSAVIIAALVIWYICKRRMMDTAKVFNPDEEQGYELEELDHEVDKWEVSRDRIVLREVIGSGAFGVVWKGSLKEPGRGHGRQVIAAKCLTPTSGAEGRKALMREIELGKKLEEQSQPNIITFIGCVTTRIHPILVMEYLPCGDLLGYLRKSRGIEDKYHRGEGEALELGTYDFVSFARQIATGMVFLGSKGIIHRDLAARNILLDRNCVCKITGFGLAYQNFKYGHGNTKKGCIPVKWTAPEILYGNPAALTSQSDVWSYGIVLYEIFTIGTVL